MSPTQTPPREQQRSPWRDRLLGVLVGAFGGLCFVLVMLVTYLGW